MITQELRSESRAFKVILVCISYDGPSDAHNVTLYLGHMSYVVHRPRFVRHELESRDITPIAHGIKTFEGDLPDTLKYCDHHTEITPPLHIKEIMEKALQQAKELIDEDSHK